MTDETLSLDKYRSTDAQQQTMARRQRLELTPASPDECDEMRERLESYTSAPYAESWSEAATMAIYLLRLFAMADESQEPARRRLIAKVIEDLSQLSDTEPK